MTIKSKNIPVLEDSDIENAMKSLIKLIEEEPILETDPKNNIICDSKNDSDTKIN